MRNYRFVLIMQACRPLWDLAASDSAMYDRAREGLDDLVAELRGSTGPVAPGGAEEPLHQRAKSVAAPAGVMAIARPANRACSMGSRRLPSRRMLRAPRQ